MNIVNITKMFTRFFRNLTEIEKSQIVMRGVFIIDNFLYFDFDGV